MSPESSVPLPPIRRQLDPKVLRVELAISTLLRVGVVSSLVVVVVGLVLSLIQHHSWLYDPAALQAHMRNPSDIPHQLSTVVWGVFQGEGLSIVMAGLLLLISTPVTRVALSIALFAYQKDRTFIWITAGVLVLLVLSLFVGKHT